MRKKAHHSCLQTTSPNMFPARGTLLKPAYITIKLCFWLISSIASTNLPSIRQTNNPPSLSPPPTTREDPLMSHMSKMVSMRLDFTQVRKSVFSCGALSPPSVQSQEEAPPPPPPPPPLCGDRTNEWHSVRDHLCNCHVISCSSTLTHLSAAGNVNIMIQLSFRRWIREDASLI